jgi:hypothetical protein
MKAIYSITEDGFAHLRLCGFLMARNMYIKDAVFDGNEADCSKISRSAVD